jgi:ribonucleoside-diphosphate reductase alpha chain
VISNGLVRGRPGDKLMLVRGVAGGEAPAVRAMGGAGASGYVQGATALKGELSESAPLTMGGVAFSPAHETVADKRAEARMKGYVGEACPECGNFTMVRNGTCLKCDTCGSTTGCS